MSSRGSGGNASGGRTQALGGNDYRQVSAALGMRQGLERTGYVRTCQNYSPFCRVCLDLA